MIKLVCTWFIVGVSLWFLDLKQVPNYGLFVLCGLLSFPFYQFIRQWSLLRRRAFLAHVANSESRIRSLLWNSHFAQMVSVFPAIAAATVLLTTTNSLKISGQYDAWVLFAGLIGFLLVLPRVRRRLKAQIQPEHEHAVAIRVSFWTVFLLMLAVSITLWIFVYQVPDVRHLAWQPFIESEFSIGRAGANSELAGYLIGAQKALDGMAWHFMQTASLPPVAWLIFALYQALQLYVVFIFFISFYLLLQRSPNQPSGLSPVLKQLGFWQFLLGIVLIAAVVGVYVLSSKTEIQVPSEVEEVVEPQNLTCTRDMLRELEDTSEAHLQQQEERLTRLVEDNVATELDSLFGQLEQGVDLFLDWNFSMMGQYTQMYVLGRAAVTENEFEADLNARFMALSGVNMDTSMHGISTRLNETLQTNLQNMSGAQNTWVQGQFARLRNEYDCGLEAIPTFQFEEFTTYSGVGMGALGTAAYSGIRLTRFTLAARVAIQRALARRGAVRAVQTTSSAGTGSICGPLVLVCGAAVFVGADYALVKADEYAHREQLHAELIEALETERGRIETSLNEQSQLIITHFQQELSRQQEEKFNILRDGLTRKSPN